MVVTTASGVTKDSARLHRIAFDSSLAGFGLPDKADTSPNKPCELERSGRGSTQQRPSGSLCRGASRIHPPLSPGAGVHVSAVLRMLFRFQGQSICHLQRGDGFLQRSSLPTSARRAGPSHYSEQQICSWVLLPELSACAPNTNPSGSLDCAIWHNLRFLFWFCQT